MGVELFTQSLPVEVHEGVRLGNFADDAIGDASAVAEAGEVKLPHFSTAAHVVHQVERVSFAANEGHRLTPKQRLYVVYCTSTTKYNAAHVPWMENDSKALPLNDTQFLSEFIITFLAPFHL